MTGKYRDRSMQHTCSRHAAWEPHRETGRWWEAPVQRIFFGGGQRDREYPGTSFIRNTPLLGPYSRTTPGPIVVLAGVAASYERGTPAYLGRGVPGQRRAGEGARMVDKRLPGKRKSNSHGARPVNQIISMIKWVKKELCLSRGGGYRDREELGDAGTRSVWEFGTSLIRNTHPPRITIVP